MSNYNKISLAQLDIEAVADYVVARKKLVYRTDIAGTNAEDVDKVNGVAAANIAVAVSSTDRNTVQNAEQLGGVPAADYMTNTQGASIATKQLKMKQQYGDELKNLKDELYTLRQELAKGGFVEDRGEYTGYIDTFRSAAPKHMNMMLTEAMATESDTKDELFIEDALALQDLDPLDYIVVVGAISADLDKPQVRQIKEIIDERKVIRLDSPLADDVYVSPMTIFWSRGINDEGMFKFAKAAENVPSSEENHTGLSDDTYKVMKRTRVSETGFAYSFRIPKEKQGFLAAFEICAKAYGSPGSMMCYIIEDRDAEHFKNPIQAAAAYQAALEAKDDSWHFFAASQPLTLSSAYGRRYIKFDFLQEDNTYPLMTQDDDTTVRYVAIIEFLDCDNENYYDIQFLQHKNSQGILGDLELNNITYTYTRQADTSRKAALVTDEEINATDLYYQIVTRSVIENEVEPEKEGLYTFHVHTKDPADKARVMLRIRKEGAYVADTEDTLPTVIDGQMLKLKNTDASNNVKSITELHLDSQIYKPLELRATEADISEQVPVIVGANIAKLAGRNEASITLEDPALVNNEDPVYRMAYTISLKARYDNGFDEPPAYKHFVLPLKEVFKDFRKKDKTSSDRLLFEANLFTNETDAVEYNDFIVQIYWSNRDMSDYTDIRKSQMGAIKDIAVAFNMGF